METYLQKAWGDCIENVTIEDVNTAISETIEMDDEHGAFGIGLVDEFEIVLEVHKDLTVIGVFTEDEHNQTKAIFNTWEEIKELYKLFLNNEIDKVKSALEMQEQKRLS